MSQMQFSQGFGYCINKFTGGVNDKNRKILTSQIFDDGTPSICVCKSIDARFFVPTDLLPLAQRLHTRLLLFYDPSRTQRFTHDDDSLIQFLYAARVAPEKTIRYRPAISVLVTATDNVRLNNGYP
jgi:hypothetical protein